MDAQEKSSLLIPLRSNAHGLLAGAPVAAVRRRLKAASLYHDSMLLELGVLRLSAGPNGSTAIVEHNSRAETKFQTSRERNAAQSGGFVVSIGAESTPGVASTDLAPFLQSQTTAHWTATLEPFIRELPSGCDWVELVQSRDPQGDAAKLASTWTNLDHANAALRQAIPEQFVRSLVIKHANRDLALATHAGLALTQDGLHGAVVARRFGPARHEQTPGFAIPILFPRVGDLSWADIQALRQDRHMVRFRKIMRDVEAQALDQALSGDVEAAAHSAYQAVLARAAGEIETLTTRFKRLAMSLVLGGASGIATMGLAGPTGVVVGAGTGTIIEAGREGVSRARVRRDRGWLSLAQRLAE